MRIVTKRKMTVCCAILAVIFFAAGLFGLCVPMQAHAEEVTPANIVTADGATVTPEKLNTGATADDGYDVTGLTVEGGAGYSATLNGVFKDDVRLDFALLSNDIISGNTKGKGHFTFTVASASDPDDHFEIHIVPSIWNRTTIYVQYQGDYRMATDSGQYFHAESINDLPDIAGISGDADGYTWVKAYLAGADYANDDSYIRLKREAGVLSVVAVSAQNNSEYTIAKFDGETVPASIGVVANKTTYSNCCLPKLIWEDGCIISFGSDYTDASAPENDGTDICLTKLTVGETAYDLTGSTAFETEPQWYTDYQSRATITLAEAPAAYWNKALGAYTVPAATYTTVGNSVPQAVENIKLAKDGTEVSISNGKATFEEDGTYTLTYTAIEGSSAVGNTLSYTVNVGSYLPAKDLIDGLDATAGKLNTGANEGDGYDVTGLTVEGGAGYSATFNGVFKEDVKLDFALLSKIAAEGGNGFGGKGRLTFRIADAGDPDTYFEIVIRSEDWFGSSRNFAYVRYGDEIRWRVHGADGGGNIFDVDVLENTEMAQYAYVAIPMDGADANTENSYIKLSWSGEAKDVLNVSVMCGHEYGVNRREIVIASFDGTDALNNETRAYGLEKLTGMKENGFTISFGSDYTDETNPENDGTDICFKKITVGEKEYDLSAAVLCETAAPDWYEAYENIVVWNVKDGEDTVPDREYTVREATYSLRDGVTEGKAPFKTEYAYLGADGEDEPSWTEITEGKFTPIEAGIYEIRYTAAEDGDNINNTYSYRVTVRAVQQIAKPTLPEGSSVTYDAKEHSVTITENDAYTVTGTLLATDAGTYTVTVSLKDKVFTEWADGKTEDVTLSWTIAKAKVSAPNAPAQVTYNGKEQTAAVAENAAYTLEGNKQTNAGTYEITVTLSDTKNYEWSDGTSEALTLSWTIAKATPVITADAAQSAEYDGEAQDVTASVAGVNGEKLTVTMTWYSDAEHEHELDGAPVEAGTYYAVLSYAGSDNYAAAQSVNVTFTVTEDADEPSDPSGPSDPTGPSDPSGPSDPTDPSEPSGTEEPKGLGGGEIAAIVIVCVIVVGAGTALGIVLYKNKSGKAKKK